MTYAKEALALMALKCRKREKIQKKMSGSVVMMPEESEEKEDDDGDEARDTIDDAATVRVSRTGTGRQRQEEQPVNLGGRSEHWP